MSVVDHYPCAVLFGKTADLGQVGDVAAHAENAVGDYERAGGLRYLPERGFEIGHIVMPVAQHFAKAELACVVDTRVVFFVADDVVAPADERADYAQIRLEARGKRHNRLFAQKLGELGFEIQMQLQRSVEEAGAGTARAVFLERFDAGFDDLGVHGEPEVVVGAEHYAALAFHYDFRVLLGLQGVEIRIYAEFPQLGGAGVAFEFLKKIHIALPFEFLIFS